MKFKNEYVKIKTNKEVIMHNYIYDSYLELFSKSQYETDEQKISEMNNQKQFYSCFIKIEEKIKDVKNATKSEFDLAIYDPIINVNGSSNSVTTIYNYMTTDNKIYNLKEQKTEDLNVYKDKKITAIGFGLNEVMACIDTFDYGVYIVEGEKLTIARKDKMTTDGECIGIDYPLHIASVSNKTQILESEAIYVPIWARLYSIGFGTTKGIIDDEYIIGKDIEVIKENNTEFGFNLLKGFEESIYPNETLYAGADLYPMPLYKKEEKYPSTDLYATDSMYPMQANYKYIIYKYRLFFYDTMQDKLINLDEYYTLNYFENQAKGLFEIKTKISRKE